MIQPVFLQAFASIAVQVVADRQSTESSACARDGRSGFDAAGVVKETEADQPGDQVELSEEGLAAAEQEAPVRSRPPHSEDEAQSADESAKGDSDATEVGDAAIIDALTEEEQQQVTELKSRDREVRNHEQAHLSAAGPYATGGPTFEYQKGPDGRRYAIGGEVGIDTSPVSGDPEATIRKAQQIRAAALAPASPSGQDQRVAAAATQMEAQARMELAKEQRVSQSSYGETPEASLTGTLLDLVA